MSCLLGPLGRMGKWMGKMGKAAGCNSFVADTLVHMKPVGNADAQSGKSVLRRIDQIKVGDEVLASSEWKVKGAIPKRNGQLSYEKVTDVFASHQPQRIIHLTLSNGARLSATEGHPFNTTEGWRDAVLLKKGGKLLLKGDEADAAEQAVTIAAISEEEVQIAVFNIEVANAHTYFVGEEGTLVHNGKCNIGVKHPSRKRAREAAEHPHPGKKLPQPKKDAPKAKRDAYEEQQKYRKPERHPDSKHPDSHYHDANKSNNDVNVHHYF